MDFIDLHVHTLASDGRLSPAQVLQRAADLGLRAVAITDHDTMDGYLVARSVPTTVELVPGVEVKAEYRGREIHLLGYYLDPGRLSFADRARQDRSWRNGEMLRRMALDGVPLSQQELNARRPGQLIGRPHMAQLLVEKGLFPSVQAAFDAWLGEGGKYYVPQKRLSVAQAAAELRAAGGKAVLAHPLQYGLSEEALRALLALGREGGLVGLEALYAGYTAAETAYLTGLAGDFGLCVTGGSDFHGDHRPGNPLGGVMVPYRLLETLREA